MLEAVTRAKLLFELDKMALPVVNDVRGIAKTRDFDRILVGFQDGKELPCRI